MLTNYAAAAHWPVDASRLDLVEEFRVRPRGPHGDELQKLLHRMRWSGDPGESGRYVLVTRELGRLWVLARLPRVRGAPVEIIGDRVFTSFAAAEWEVFVLRWESLTGQALPARIKTSFR